MLMCVLFLALLNTCSSDRYDAAEAIQHAIFGEEADNVELMVEAAAAPTDTAGEAAVAPADTAVDAAVAPADTAVEVQLIVSATESAADAATEGAADAATESAADAADSATEAADPTQTENSATQVTTKATTRAAAATQTTPPQAGHLYIYNPASHYNPGSYNTGSYYSSRRRSSSYGSSRRRRSGSYSSRRRQSPQSGSGSSQHVANAGSGGSHYHGSGGSGGRECEGNSPTSAPTAKIVDSTPSANGGKTKSGKKSGYTFKQMSGMSANSAPGQAGNFYFPQKCEHIPRVEPCQTMKCHLSLAVIMDSSGSVGEHDYQKELSFVKTLLSILAVKAEESKLKVCTGLVSYSTEVHVEVDPCCENTMCRIVDQFRAGNLQYRAGSTNTHSALKVARQMLQAAASYKKVALLITDGKSNDGGSPVPFAKKMREQDDIQIVALGVTADVNEAELMGVSGMDRVTKIDVFDEFHELASILLQANKVSSQNELNRSFRAVCRHDKSLYKKDGCTRQFTEEQRSQCVLGKWSECTRKGNKCSKTRTCELNRLVIVKEEEACECPPCPMGTYLKRDGYCDLCAPGTFNGVEGATFCIPCPENLFSDPGSFSESDCYKLFDIVDDDGNSVSGEGSGGLLLYKGGTVCDDYFDDTAANAVCKQMGRPYGDAQWESGKIHPGSYMIKLDNVGCYSADWSSCNYSETHNCSHSEDVYIVCKGSESI